MWEPRLSKALVCHYGRKWTTSEGPAAQRSGNASPARLPSRTAWQENQALDTCRQPLTRQSDSAWTAKAVAVQRLQKFSAIAMFHHLTRTRAKPVQEAGREEV